MGAIYKTGFDRAVQNGGLTSLGNWRRGLTLDGSGFAVYDFTVTSGSNSNPYENVQNAWSRSGDRLLDTNTDWGTWTSDGSQTIGALDVEVSDGGGGFIGIGRVDGNNLPQSVSDAVEVTAGINSTDGTLNFVRPGLAEIVVRGLSNTTAYYVLLDSGTPIGGGATVNEGGSAPSWNYDSVNSEFSAGADVVFSNSSGSSWNVTAIEVRENSETGDAIFQDTSVSATVADGGSITFTDITLSVGGLT